MTRQSKKMESIPFSAIRKTLAEVARLKAEGKDVIGLGIGEPDFTTPSHIIEALAEAARRGETHYTPNKGIPELRNAIVEQIKKDSGLTYDSEEIICTVGATEGVYLALTAFLNPGDEVLTPDPAWLSYAHVPVLSEAVAIPYPLTQQNGFQVDVDSLEARVTPKTKMIALINPSNPIGAVQTLESLEKLAAFVKKYDLLVVVDEIYDKLIYDGLKQHYFAALPGMRERTIVLNGFSKTYAMTGWRLGWVAAPIELINVMTRLHMYTVTHPSSMVQWAGVAALKGPQEPVMEMVREFDRRRRFLLEAFSNTPGISCARPGGAFYLFPDVSGTGMNGDEFSSYLLKNYYVAVIPGSTFGQYGTNHVRVSYAASMEEIEKAAERINRAMTEKLGG